MDDFSKLRLRIWLRCTPCETCRLPLLLGWCWRRAAFRGHWFAHATHYQGKVWRGRARLGWALNAWAQRVGL